MVESNLTCPKCGVSEKVEMPSDQCIFFHPCAGCGLTMQPLEGDCCVFCSYGDVACPPKENISSDSSTG
ncbi:MAG TPA: hypothetical protein EYN46_07125 [Candidatus Poseidoniales archaeon]|nr:MAG: hypothetical protein CXX80_08010 [Euryarchaeota archaeon]HIO95113.1 hypothetical protein [Candidatus Poseidoniales archaeon]